MDGIWYPVVCIGLYSVLGFFNLNILYKISYIYDFCFASHVLEHIANPLKALQGWIRIVKPGGHIILVLPEKNEVN
jgi:SAM-dependent methyltransferase